jgi:hypothetical protein
MQHSSTSSMHLGHHVAAAVQRRVVPTDEHTEGHSLQPKQAAETAVAYSGSTDVTINSKHG